MTYTCSWLPARESSAWHSAQWTIFRTRRSASVDDASLLKY